MFSTHLESAEDEESTARTRAVSIEGRWLDLTEDDGPRERESTLQKEAALLALRKSSVWATFPLRRKGRQRPAVGREREKEGMRAFEGGKGAPAVSSFRAAGKGNEEMKSEPSLLFVFFSFFFSFPLSAPPPLFPLSPLTSSSFPPLNIPFNLNGKVVPK